MWCRRIGEQHAHRHDGARRLDSSDAEFHIITWAAERHAAEAEFDRGDLGQAGRPAITSLALDPVSARDRFGSVEGKEDRLAFQLQHSGDPTGLMVDHDLVKSGRDLIEAPCVSRFENVEGGQRGGAHSVSSAHYQGDRAVAYDRTGTGNDGCTFVHGRDRGTNECVLQVLRAEFIGG